jgi:pimeloyl-ACP methyl ester carboxylesterase
LIGKPTSFTVSIPEEHLEDLRRRLRETRWAMDFGNEGWKYGVERGWLEEMVSYWSEEFDWPAQERTMNQWPQFSVEIDGIPIHYVHVRGTGPNPQPLILSHGWPGTFWDWKDLIGPLTDPARFGNPSAPAFDVIVPSLPGMGFSTPLTTTGVHARRIAELWAKLMRDVLRYDRFCAGGYDWGAGVTTELAHIHPELLTGIWITFPFFPGRERALLDREFFAADEQWMFEQMADRGAHIQTHFAVAHNEPQTISYALADSPTGTAAWIWSRRRDWSDNDGDVLEAFDRDFLCTTASIYWLTGTIVTSMRIYNEHFISGVPPLLHGRARVIEVPTGLAVFPKDNLYVPRKLVAEWSDLRRWTVMPQGGHFGPSEQPELCVAELREFFGAL